MGYDSCPKCQWLTNTEENDYCEYCGYSFNGISNEHLFNHYNYQAYYYEELEQSDKNRIILMYVKIIETMTSMQEIVDKNRNNIYRNLDEGEDFSWWKERLFEDIKDKIVDMLDEVNSYLPGMMAEGKFEELPKYLFDKQIATFVSDAYEPIIDLFADRVKQINFDVELEYEREVRENGQLGFGVLTNSFIGAALYAVQSGMKEAKAEIAASENRALTKANKINELDGEITQFWQEQFEIYFEPLFNVWIGMVMEQLEEIILSNSGYTWDDVLEWIQSL